MAATLRENLPLQIDCDIMTVDRRKSPLQYNDDMSTTSNNLNYHSDSEFRQTNSPSFNYFQHAKCEFNKNRKMLIKNIPSDASDEDVKIFFWDYKVLFIDRDINSQQVEVTLENCDEVEATVSELDNTEILDTSVSVCPVPSRRLVGVAHLPPAYTLESLRELMESHGSIDRLFLMGNEEAGVSKGYGFVEFGADVNRIQDFVDNMDMTDVNGCKIHVDLIDENCQSWDKLQSRCLLIDNLPWDFVDIKKLREIFSVDTSPVYCQIAVKEGKCLGYGIVEYRDYMEAEQAWSKLQCHMIKDKPINMTFCLPGKPAVVIYNRIMWKMDKSMEPSGKSSLLPDPLFVSPALLNSPLVKGFTTQFPLLMPTFMKCLQLLHQSYINSVLTRNTKPGLLGPAPFPPFSPILDPNMQLGLLAFITLQMQAQRPQQFKGPLAKQINFLCQQTSGVQEFDHRGGKPSLLGDPMTARANMLMQNLKQQLNSSSMSDDPPSNSNTPKPLLSLPFDPPHGSQDPAFFLSFFQQNMQNVKKLNLNLLMSFGQLIQTMHKKQAEFCDNEVQPDSPNFTRNGPSEGRDRHQSYSQKQFHEHSSSQSIMGGNKTSLLGEAPSFNHNEQQFSSYDNQKSFNSRTPKWSPANEELGTWDVPHEYGQHYPEKHFNDKNLTDSNLFINSNTFSNMNKYKDYSSNNPSSISYSGGNGLLPTPGGSSTPFNAPFDGKSLLATPGRQKRNYSCLLPAPEPSPEGCIVGQHSQGIGGHYADSYSKRIKLDDRY